MWASPVRSPAEPSRLSDGLGGGLHRFAIDDGDQLSCTDLYSRLAGRRLRRNLDIDLFHLLWLWYFDVEHDLPDRENVVQIVESLVVVRLEFDVAVAVDPGNVASLPEMKPCVCCCCSRLTRSWL